MSQPRTLETLEAAAKDHLANDLDARSWGEKCHPQLILQLTAQLRVYQKHAERPQTQLF